MIYYTNLLLLSALSASLVLVVRVEAGYPQGFYNKSGCLYSHILDGHYLVTFSDGSDSQRGVIDNFNYEDSRSNCTNGLFPGNLVVTFPTSDNNMNSMTLEFLIKPAPSEGYWEISKATLQISPSNKDHFPNQTIELLPIDMYAAMDYSFSCSSLVLQSRAIKGAPFFKITLNRFQVQPSPEGYKTVFNSSYDCAVWITMPLLMGLLLLLFITFTVMMGVNLILQQGNQTSDLRFSKQGGMLMNQAQMDATKG